ncbi:GNAT family N-acetyltransferase [Kutzneria chonburiensis]|uniref:GNAT family N-acetyltransferase n=1 Tax=Kutzneria chonburiensis TaxID=1483604 RepID=A0ABV6N0J9_9PSEU|nr:GNAT family N-acetyltransferase [Kutzneria chonburiensis]
MHREAERVEAAFVTECLSEGIVTYRVGGGVVAKATPDPGHFWTRAFAFDRPLTDEEMLSILDFHQGAGELQLAPWAFPPGWERIRRSHGLIEADPWVKVACDIGQARCDDSAFPITEIGAIQADEWAGVIAGGFGLGPHLRPTLAASVGKPGARHFIAWDGAQAVGAACLYQQGELGYLTTTATVASHRGRGIQSALISRRVKEAAAAGCQRLVAETGQPAPGRPNPSFGNLTRAGLRPLHVRRNFQSDSR